MKRTPRPHQKEAIKASVNHFKKHNKGKLIMACGTGKTLTALWIAEALKANKILITVPSLNLSAQNLDQWQAEHESIGKKTKFLCVCSDDTVGHLKDENGNISSKVPVTTNLDVMRDFVKNNKNFVIITTYASGDNLIKAMSKIAFCVGIYDEAHRTAGPDGKFSSKLILDENIKAKKKLFMTATERIYSGEIDDVISMDDEKIYGKKYHELTFRDAIQRGILCDYEVKIVHVDDEQVQQWLEANSNVKDHRAGIDDTMRSVTAAIMLCSEFNDGRIHRCISYHSTIKNAMFFDETINSIAKKKKLDLKSFHINGGMKNSVRKDILKNFTKNKNTVLTNSRTLTEGIDIPNLDSIAFVDRRNSVVDIAQALGRAIRIDKSRPNKKAVVYLPISSESNKEYAEILKIVRDLVMIDSKLANAVREENYRNIDGLISIKSNKSKVRISLPKLLSVIKFRRILGKILDKPEWSDIIEYCNQHGIKRYIQYKNAYDAGKLPANFPKFLHVVYPNEYYQSELYTHRGVKADLSRIGEYITENNIKRPTDYENQFTAKTLPASFPSLSWLYQTYGVEQISKLFVIITFPQIENHCNNKGIKTITQYKQLFAAGKLPWGFPSTLESGRFKHEYRNSNLFVTNKSPRMQRPDFMTLIKICKNNGVKCQGDYRRLHKLGYFPSNFPTKPWDVYSEELKQHPEITILNPNRVHVESYAKKNEVIAYCKKHKLSGNSYIAAYRAGKLPANFPSHPATFYGVSDFFTAYKLTNQSSRPSASELRKMYLVLKMTLKEIAQKYNVTPTCIAKWLSEHSIYKQKNKK